MLGLDTWQSALLIILILISISYTCQVIMDKLATPAPIVTGNVEGIEGFIGSDAASASEAASAAEQSKYEWLTGDELYDDFYVSTHHKIFQHEKLVQAEAAIALQDWTKRGEKGEMSVLDIACGSGVATCYLAKQGAGSVVGLDKSKAMIRYAKNSILPGTTLTGAQQKALEFRVGDVYNPSAADPAEFTHSMLLYFSVYCFRDLDALFKNIYFWTQPGGSMVIEVVDKYKFLPIPDVANPWMVNPQAHTKDRMTKGAAEFDKFTYESSFELDDNIAEYRETFRFKDGTVRRQKHTLYMPDIKEIIRRATDAGWVYQQYTDLAVVGFDHGYLLFFTKA